MTKTGQIYIFDLRFYEQTLKFASPGTGSEQLDVTFSNREGGRGQNRARSRASFLMRANVLEGW